MWIAELRDQVQLMVKDVKEAVDLAKSFDRRIKALEQVAFGDGKPKKVVKK